MGHTWYLALDIQIYVFAPLFLIPLFRSKIVGAVVGVLLVLASVGATYATYFHYKFPPSIVGLYLQYAVFL